MSTQVQSVLFDRDIYSLTEAKKWLRDNDFIAPKVDKTDRYLRFRQKEPNYFNESSFRTIPFGKDTGIKAIIGVPMKGNPFYAELNEGGDGHRVGAYAMLFTKAKNEWKRTGDPLELAKAKQYWEQYQYARKTYTPIEERRGYYPLLHEYDSFENAIKTKLPKRNNPMTVIERQSWYTDDIWHKVQKEAKEQIRLYGSLEQEDLEDIERPLLYKQIIKLLKSKYRSIGGSADFSDEAFLMQGEIGEDGAIILFENWDGDWEIFRVDQWGGDESTEHDLSLLEFIGEPYHMISWLMKHKKRNNPMKTHKNPVIEGKTIVENLKGLRKKIERKSFKASVSSIMKELRKLNSLGIRASVYEASGKGYLSDYDKKETSYKIALFNSSMGTLLLIAVPKKGSRLVYLNAPFYETRISIDEDPSYDIFQEVEIISDSRLKDSSFVVESEDRYAYHPNPHCHCSGTKKNPHCEVHGNAKNPYGRSNPSHKKNNLKEFFELYNEVVEEINEQIRAESSYPVTYSKINNLSDVSMDIIEYDDELIEMYSDLKSNPHCAVHGNAKNPYGSAYASRNMLTRLNPSKKIMSFESFMDNLADGNVFVGRYVIFIQDGVPMRLEVGSSTPREVSPEVAFYSDLAGQAELVGHSDIDALSDDYRGLIQQAGSVSKIKPMGFKMKDLIVREEEVYTPDFDFAKKPRMSMEALAKATAKFREPKPTKTTTKDEGEALDYVNQISDTIDDSVLRAKKRDKGAIERNKNEITKIFKKFLLKELPFTEKVMKALQKAVGSKAKKLTTLHKKALMKIPEVIEKELGIKVEVQDEDGGKSTPAKEADKEVKQVIIEVVEEKAKGEPAVDPFMEQFKKMMEQQEQALKMLKNPMGKHYAFAMTSADHNRLYDETKLNNVYIKKNPSNDFKFPQTEVNGVMIDNDIYSWLNTLLPDWGLLIQIARTNGKDQYIPMIQQALDQKNELMVQMQTKTVPAIEEKVRKQLASGKTLTEIIGKSKKNPMRMSRKNTKRSRRYY